MLSVLCSSSSLIPKKRPLARRSEQEAKFKPDAINLEQELEWVLQQVLEFDQELSNGCTIGCAVVG